MANSLHTFGGFPCLNSRMLSRQRKTSEIVRNRANSYRCPTGSAWGQGWCLLTGENVAKLTPSTGYAFTMKSGTDSITLAKAYVLRIVCVSPGSADEIASPFQTASFFSSGTLDRTGAYLVEFVDRRYFLSKFTTITQTYNFRCLSTQRGTSDSAEFYADSLNGGSLWNWYTLLYSIWDSMGTLATSLTVNFGTLQYPANVPENLSFLGLSAWDAFNQVVEMIGGNLVYSPANDDFTLTPSLTKQLSTSQKTKLDKIRVFDYDNQEVSIQNLPANFIVHFQRQEQHAGTEPENGFATSSVKSWLPNSVITKTVSTRTIPGLGLATILPGTSEPLWSPKPAFIEPDGTTFADSSLNAEAYAIASAVALDRYDSSVSGKTIFSGLPANLVPGSELKIVTYRDYPDDVGCVTEVCSHRGSTEQQAEAYEDLSRSSFGASENGLGFSSREATDPPDYSRKTTPSFPRGYSLVAIDNAIEGGVTNPQYEIDNTITYALPGRIVILDPTTHLLPEWNASHTDMVGQECFLVWPNLLGEFEQKYGFPYGQVFHARLQGVSTTFKPIFVIDHPHIFFSGTLKNGETLSRDGTAIAVTAEGIEYRVSGRFIPTGKEYVADSEHTIRVGWIADPNDIQGVADVEHYWKVIVADICPTTVA